MPGHAYAISSGELKIQEKIVPVIKFLCLIFLEFFTISEEQVCICYLMIIKNNIAFSS